MTSGNGSAVSTGNALAKQYAQLPGNPHHPPDDARANCAHPVTVTAAKAATELLSTQSAIRASFDDALPVNDFLRDLNREKRRAERSQAALSLILYDVKDHNGQDHADRLLEVLHTAKRDTDIIGHVADNRIAVLCPDTDAQGTKGFIRKIDSQAASLPCAAVAATYPDDVFDNLANGTRTQPAFQPFLAFDQTDKRHSGYPLKRGLDIVGALIALVLLGPLMLVVAAAIALTSPGPVIFKQTRLGKGGVSFTFYKFRSMVTEAGDGIHRDFVASLIKEGQAERTSDDGKPAPYKLHCDPRVTRVGRFIRKTSIDELPQFFNVLKGDMSLVGPRPPIPYETAHYQPWHLRRILAIKPGITGLWQVNGRSRVTFNDMVRMDLRYIRDCSLATDLKIVIKTILVVLRCEGAT